MLRVAEGHALGFQQRTLLGPAGNQPPCMVDDTVTGIAAVVFRVAQHTPHEAGVAFPADEEDPIIQDNMAQTYYRLAGDKTKAKEYFDKAHKLKATQIDTLWFLSRYDVEAGNNAAALEKLNAALEGRFSPLNYANKQMIEDEIKRLGGK